MTGLLGPRLAALPGSGMVLQRACAACADGECDDCRQHREATLERAKSESAAGPASANAIAPPIVHQVLQAFGQPLAATARSTMENRFHNDFSHVRIHTDPKANESATAVGALAYTVGNHIAFARGQYAPETNEGQKLLAHELTHVVQQRSAAIGGSIPIGPIGGAAEQKAQRIGGGAGQIPAESRGATLQRQPSPACVRLINQPGASDPLTGIAVQREILRHFRRRVGRPVPVHIPDASAGPFRTERHRRIIDPQTGGGPREGEGHPDLAYRRRRGDVMLLAEIKPANWYGFTFAESQLLNYLDKGNSPDNADLRRALGVRVFSPMLRNTYSPPHTVTVGRRRFRVMWCGPGIIVYKHVKPRRRRRRRDDDRRRRRRQETRRRRQQAQRRRTARTRTGGGSAGGFNFGFGLSLGSSGAGAGNIGVGISINSQGVAVGTVSAGIAYDSQGAALGAVGAGVASGSESVSAGTAGAGVVSESSTAGAGVAGAGTVEGTTAAGAGVAGAGTVEGSTVAGAGVAGAGSMRDATGAAAGQASSGDFEGSGSGGTRAEGEHAEGDAGEGAPGGTREGAADGGTGSREGGAGAAGAGGAGAQRTTQQEGGQAAGQQTGGQATGQRTGGRGTRLEEIVARLQLEIPDSSPSQVEQAVVEAARLDALVTQASPAQIQLLRLLAASRPNGVYSLPAPAWVEMILSATAGISTEDLEYLAGLEWEPASTTLDQLREAIRLALDARRSAAQAQPARPQTPARPNEVRESGDGTTGRRGETTSTGQTPAEGQRQQHGGPTAESAEETGAGQETQPGRRRRRRQGGRGRRRSRLRPIPASRVFAALSAVDWSNTAPGDIVLRPDQNPPLLCGRTANGTRWGAFVQPGPARIRRRRVEVVADSSSIVLLDDAVEGDAIQFGGQLTFIHAPAMSGSVRGPAAGEAVDDGSTLLGLILRED